MTRARRSRGTLGALVASAIALAGASHLVSDDRGIARGATTPSYPVTITTKVDARGRGTFTLRGGLADAGRASARRAVVNGRLLTSATLAGAKGRIVLTSSQSCARAAGTWRAVSGTGAYAGIAGRGTTGRGLCKRPFRAATTVLRGTVALPPAPLARPGAYGGWTAQDKALAFTVRADARTIGDVMVG